MTERGRISEPMGSQGPDVLEWSRSLRSPSPTRQTLRSRSPSPSRVNSARSHTRKGKTVDSIPPSVNSMYDKSVALLTTLCPLIFNAYYGMYT